MRLGICICAESIFVHANLGYDRILYVICTAVNGHAVICQADDLGQGASARFGFTIKVLAVVGL